MKKILVSVLAIAGLVACNNENVISEANNSQAITFGAFVENATRANDPSTTTTNIEEFSVWGYMNSEKGIVFNDELVSRSGDSWVYTNLQYWLPGNRYHFAAFAGDRTDVQGLPENAAMGAEGLGTITFHNVEGTNDILYAQTDRYAEATATPINLQFAHLLSKVKFTFKNGFANPNNYVVVSDITMDVPAQGDLTLNKAAYDAKEYIWANHAETTTLQFGHMNNAAKLAIGGKETSDNERLTIPAAATQNYTINFTVEVYNGEERGLVRDMEVKLTGFEFVAGRAYNLVATINQENLDLNAIEFQVVVDEWIEQEVDGGAVEGEVTFVTTAAEIQAILDAATTDVTILFGKDIEGDVTILQKEGVDVTINGNGFNFDGVFTVNGDARATGAETLTFTGINFESNEAKTFISAPSKINDRYNYAHNITIENCTFTGAYDQGVEVGSASFTGAYNIVMKNCVATNMHSLLQTQSVDNTVLVENVKVVASKNGLSFGNTAYPTLRNAEIEAEFYGVRADGNASRGNLVIENSTIEAAQPVVIRKVTTAGYKVNVDAASVLTNTGLYQVIFTKGSDDEAYVAPEVDFTFNGPANLLVFPRVIVADNAETMAAALKANNKNINIMLANDIDLPINTLGQQTGGSGEYKLGGEATETINIDLNGKKLNITTTYWSALGAKNENALFTIKNGTMTSSQTSGTWNSYDLCFANCNYNFENVVFEKAIALEAANKAYNLKNVTITETHDYYPIWISAKGQNVTIDGLTIESAGRGIKIDEQYVNAPAKVTLNVDNATFKTAKKAAVIVKSVAGAEINWGAGNSIAEVAEDTDFAVWVDEDAAAYADLVVVSGALVKVEGANTQAIATDTELREALKNGNDVVLTEDITTTDADSNGYGATGININGGVFDGNGHTIAVEGATSTWDSAIAIKGGTIKNVTVAKGFRGIFFKNGTEKIVLENVIIDGPTYTISCDQAGKQGFEAYNSTFKGWTSYAGTIGTGYFEGCTFGAGAGYNFSRPYAPTTYVNCDFEAGHKIDARAAITFENCRVNGVALTSENLGTLVSGNIQNATVIK